MKALFYCAALLLVAQVSRADQKVCPPDFPKCNEAGNPTTVELSVKPEVFSGSYANYYSGNGSTGRTTMYGGELGLHVSRRLSENTSMVGNVDFGSVFDRSGRAGIADLDLEFRFHDRPNSFGFSYDLAPLAFTPSFYELSLLGKAGVFYNNQGARVSGTTKLWVDPLAVAATSPGKGGEDTYSAVGIRTDQRLGEHVLVHAGGSVGVGNWLPSTCDGLNTPKCEGTKGLDWVVEGFVGAQYQLNKHLALGVDISDRGVIKQVQTVDNHNQPISAAQSASSNNVTVKGGVTVTF